MDGIFLRGGVTIGDIYADSRALFGPALVRAYELESTTAKWPIVALDPELVHSINAEVPKYLESRRAKEGRDGEVLGAMFVSELRAIINRTDEGTYFLDYLQCLAYEDLTTGDLDYFLADHKEKVVEAYGKYWHYNYIFVAQYHDAACRANYPENGDLWIGKLE
jgi:hypothetical protein